jgi:hypothetical protein
LFAFNAPENYPGNPFPGQVTLRKIFYDLPPSVTDSRQENMGGAFGIRGGFLDTWRYDISASWARNVVKDDSLGGFSTAALSAAINAGLAPGGDPSQIPLLAYDSFNGVDPNPAGMLLGFRTTSEHEDTTDVYEYSATADGSLWSGWAGDIRMAIGVEQAEEKVKFFRNPTVGFALSAPFSREATAAFAEINVPLLSERQNLPFVHRMEVGAAMRRQEYSDAGRSTPISKA